MFNLKLIKTFAILSVITLALLVTGCNRAAVRIPGLSDSFPSTATGYSAKQPVLPMIVIAMPVDLRKSHIGETVANTKWKACSTDALWTDTASGILNSRLNQELAASNLINREISNSDTLTLKTEIHAFCSQAVGAFIVRVAGISAINFSVEKNGKVIWQKKIEHVVTDADAEYSGSQLTSVEQAMRTTMADSLRLTIKDFLVEIDKDLPNAIETSRR